MADTFTPRGAPVPVNSYDGWELTHRPAMLPFLAEYTNPQGETAGGWAMPNMVTEPVNALFRLMNTPAGTMPDPRDPQNQSDALTGLMALYGGNALGGVARNALGKGVAHGLNMEAARPVAYSNAIDEAMSNPNMLSMMRDIDYANLNRRALDEYGVGYEGLTSSQEAKLRGWSDPALLSDTGRPNPVGAGVASHLDMSPEARLARAREQGFDTNTTWYHGSFNDFDAFDPRTIGDNFAADDKGFFFSNVPSQASDYALSDTVGLPKDGGMVYPTHIKFERPLIVDESRLRREGMGGVLGKTEDPISFWDNYQGLLHEWAAKEGADGITIVDNSYKVPHGPNKGQSSMMHVAFNPEDIRSVNAAFDPAKADSSFLLASDTGKPNPAGAALAGNKPNADVMASYGLRDGPLAPAIAKAISDPGEFYYGIRTTPYKIEPGQTMPNSTEWFQDANPLPWSELLSSEQKVVRDYYPELSLDELNAMKFDPDYVEHGKPLNGSSAIEMFGPNKAPTLDDIERARRYQIYGTNGDFVHLVRSRARPESGYDLGEWIMPGAEVVSVAPFGKNLFSNASPLAGWLASGANALAQSEEQSPGDFIPHR